MIDNHSERVLDMTSDMDKDTDIQNPQKLGILLSTHPDHANLKTAVRLAEAALLARVGVYMYLIDDGIHALNHSDVTQLKQQGVHLFACAYAAQRRRHPINDQANFCGLVVLSDLIKGCDRFIALN